jgi:outer membrane receptor protein involved in Fe transport
MVGVSVTATNTGTGVTSKATSGANGSYTITLLPVGAYQVSVEQLGFKRFLRNGIAVQIGQTTRLDISMELGNISETIEVHGEEPLLLPNTSDLGTVIGRQQFQDLPLVGQREMRNPTSFMTLVPGVTGRGVAKVEFQFNSRVFSTTVSGSQSGSTEWHLDGSVLANAAEFSADPRIIGFPPDAVGGFKMTTVNASAEYGHSGGGIASFTLKSGTSQLHGSLYEYFRNDALDARGFFAPTTPRNRQNEFGVTAGGPIHKDKTFFFAWFNGFRMHQALENSLLTVPTEAMKHGDFSAYLKSEIGTDALGRPVLQGAIYDPLTSRTVKEGQVDAATGLVATSDATTRDPFPGNIIPSGRFDRVAEKILPLFPNPTLPGLTRNFGSQAVNMEQANQWGAKIDHALTGRHKIFGSFLWSRLNSPGVSPYPGALSTAIPSTNAVPTFRLSEDSVLGPNLINHATFGFNRWRFGTNPKPEAFGWPARIGWAGVNEQGLFPKLTIAGQDYGGTAIGKGAQNNFDITEGLSWITGKHALKVGFEYLKMMSNDVSLGGETGSLSFSNPATALPDFPADLTGTATGHGMASFLLGWAQSGEVRTYASGSYERSGYYAAYLQDDFKVTPKFTLNMGMRYDLYRPTVDKWNHLAWVDMRLPNPAIGGFPGTMVFANPDRRTGVDQFNKGLAPRFGLAYSFNDKILVRAGYGLFWAPGGYTRASRGLYVQGYNSINSLNSSFDGTRPAVVLQDGWPAEKFHTPPFIDPATGFNGGVHVLDRDDGHPPYLQNYTLGIQRQFPGQILLDVAYVGNKGTRLTSHLMPTNQMDPRYLPLGELLFRDIADPAVQALPVVQAFPVDRATGVHAPFANFQSIMQGNTTLGQALRPTPQYTQDDDFHSSRRIYEGTGKSNYHALQLKLEKRFSQGLSFLAAYTWSKTLTDAESQFSDFSGFTADGYNRKAEKSYSLNDYPHNLVLSYDYELPFGPGKTFANAKGAAGKIVGGWKIAGIQQYQSGAPTIIVLTDNSFNPTYLNPLWPLVGANIYFARPNMVPGVNPKSAAALSGHFDPAKDTLLNQAAFSIPDKFSLGNGPRTLGNARAFAFLNEDISLIKRTKVNERVSVEFRADFLNIFNRTIFGLGTGGDQYGSALNNLGTNQSNYPREIQFGLKINY